jgi:hydrogenase nickel incorporation protein HypB
MRSENDPAPGWKSLVYSRDRFRYHRSEADFLEKTLTLLRPNYRVAALVGDLATENDAVRLAQSQAPVKQILTGTVCHLEAAMVERSLEGWDLSQLDFLFIENVGNLVCPSS